MTEPQEPRRSRPWLTALLIFVAVIVIGFGVCVALISGASA